MAGKRGCRPTSKKLKDDNIAPSKDGSDVEEIPVEEDAMQTGSDVNTVDEAAGEEETLLKEKPKKGKRRKTLGITPTARPGVTPILVKKPSVSSHEEECKYIYVS